LIRASIPQESRVFDSGEKITPATWLEWATISVTFFIEGFSHLKIQNEKKVFSNILIDNIVINRNDLKTNTLWWNS
jgi:hypothetical protein